MRDQKGTDGAEPYSGQSPREHGLSGSSAGGGTTYLQAKTANEVMKAQERKLRLAKLKGEPLDRQLGALLTVF